MKRLTLNTILLLILFLLCRCNCKRKVITETELDIIAVIKRSPELAAYKEVLKKRDTCLQFPLNQQAYYDMSRVYLMLGNEAITRQERVDSAKKFNFTVNPCFWDKMLLHRKVFKDLCAKYPEILKLSGLAFNNLMNVN